MDIKDVIELRTLKRRVEDIQTKEMQETGNQISEKAAKERLVLSDRKTKLTESEKANARIEFWKLKLVPADFDKFFNGFKIMCHNWQDLPVEHQYPGLQKRLG
jgi:hypothetical protein